MIDPPWPYASRKNAKTRFGLGMHRYQPMKIKDILALPVQDIADDDCALFLWVPCPFIKYLDPVMTAFGFRTVTKAFTWIKMDKNGKPRTLPGHYTGSNSEDCWLGIRGHMHDKLKTKLVNQVIFSEIGEHSEKPNAEVRARISKMYGDFPKIELFARDQAPGWVSLGNEIDGTDIREAIKRLG